MTRSSARFLPFGFPTKGRGLFDSLSELLHSEEELCSTQLASGLLILVSARRGGSDCFELVPMACVCCVSGDGSPGGEPQQHEATVLHGPHNNMEAAATSLTGQSWSTCDTYRFVYRYNKMLNR
jgi:hypothetical protein